MKKNIPFLATLTIALLTTGGLRAQQWVTEINNDRYMTLNQCIAVDDATAMLGVGTSRLYPEGYTDAMGYLLKVMSDGTTISREIRMTGKQLFFFTATELMDGNYMVFGTYDDSLTSPNYDYYHHLLVMVFDSDLETVAETDYRVDTGGFGGFRTIGYHTMRCAKAENGNIVLATCPCYFIPNQYGGVYTNRFRFYEFTSDGDTIRTTVQPEYIVNFQQAGHRVENIFPNPATEGFTLIGNGNLNTSNYAFHGCYGVWNLDREMRITSQYPVVFGQYPYYYGPDNIACEGHWYDGGRYIAYIERATSLDEDDHVGWLYMLDTLAHDHGYTMLPPTDSVTLSSAKGCATAYVNDSTIFAVSYSRDDYWSIKPMQANITLIDSHLNILGRKVLKETSWDYSPPKTPIALSNGSVIIPVSKCFINDDEPNYYLYCFARNDIEITWDIVYENPLIVSSSAFPNPTKDKLNIPISVVVPGSTKLRITDINGHTFVDSFIESQGDLIIVDTHNLASGMYVYQVITGNSICSSGKFVKE